MTLTIEEIRKLASGVCGNITVEVSRVITDIMFIKPNDIVTVETKADAKICTTLVKLAKQYLELVEEHEKTKRDLEFWKEQNVGLQELMRRHFPRWRDVEEELPEKDGYYQIYDGKCIDEGFFANGQFGDNPINFKPVPVTHWMHMPKLPVKGGNLC